MYFVYGEKETEYLKQKDPKLGAIIDRIGKIERSVDTDLFSSVVQNIIGQQISTKAHLTIRKRLTEAYGELTPQVLAQADPAKLQSLGMTFRKVEYIQEFAEKVLDGSFDLAAVEKMSDEEAIAALSSLKGIGVWTAEMLLLFCLQRPDILSYGDLAIQRGLRMVYHHRRITPQLYRKYKRRYSPYGSVASLYLWAAAGGALEDLKDYAPKKKKGAKR